MKSVFLILFLSIGILSVFIFHVDVFLPIWVSVSILLGISLFLWTEYQHNRVGVMMLLLWLVYALPFIHVVPYLWFDFANENPPLLWGLMINPYMLNETIIKLTAMIGAVGGIGFALGVSLNNKAIVRDTGMNRRLGGKLSISIWMFWIIGGVVLSWLSAPESTLFTADYSEAKSALDGANFSSAWMISYVLLAFAMCDAILDQNPARKAFKRMVVFISIAFVVVFLQFLRGDRESIPFVFAVILAYFYWAAPLTQKHQMQIPWVKILVFGILLFVISMVVGGTRHSLVDTRDMDALIGLLYELKESEVFNISNLLHGTWSAVLLTPLSVAGDHVYKLLPFKFGEDYLNLFLSLPPGFIADAAGFKRPIDALAGPAFEMRYGLGGTHAAVLPFMNFRMLGVLVIPAFWAYLFTHLEKRALKRLNVTNMTFLSTIAMVAPHWLWYGEKNVLNALIIWMLLAVLYWISLLISRISAPVSKNALRYEESLQNHRVISHVP